MHRMWNLVGMAFLAIYLLACFSCGSFMDRKQGEIIDLDPPVFVGANTTRADGIELEFDEDVSLEQKSLVVTPELDIVDVSASENRLVIATGGQVPGMEYILEAVVRDAIGNSSNILVAFFGYNPSLPGILINEFTTNGSASHPDIVELKVLRPGNMAGIVLYAGVKGDWDAGFVFPSFPVQEGDFILVHFKPQGIQLEINETGDKGASGGLDASREAYDAWIEGGNGLSGNNGALSLYSSPTGTILDCVLYSNRTFDSDSSYSGFGSEKNLSRARMLAEGSGWKVKGASVAPEDCVNPDDSTSTRSLCRDRLGTDTDTKNDWHIVPTKMSSFGSENSEEVYTG